MGEVERGEGLSFFEGGSWGEWREGLAGCEVRDVMQDSVDDSLQGYFLYCLRR